LGSAAVRKLGQLSAERRAAALLSLCFADPSRLGPRRRAEAITEIEERAGMPWANDALLRATRGLARSQLLNWRAGWAAMRRVRAPSLVVWGDRDKLVAPDLAAHVAAELPDSRLLVLENVGHVAMMEVPEATARAVLGLIEDASQCPCAAPPR
jgi:pimeloyl-ACP methyl ester carboxylesterase